jgi:uncharacterized protein YndB with AHSA1/START domain
MKTVKVIITILIVLSILFFGTGLVIKENKYSTEVTIDKSLSETFALFNQQDSISKWIPEVTKVEIIQEKPGFVGSEYRIIMDNQGQLMTMKEKVLAYVENKKLTFYFDAEGVLKTDDYSFTTDGKKTTIKLEVSFQAESYILSCLFPYFKGTFKGVDNKNLNSFKAFAENY